MGWLLRLLGGPFATAAVWAVGLAFAALAAACGVLYVKNAGLRAEVATAGAAKAQCEAALTVQNAKVDQLAADCRAKADEAVAAALRALNVPLAPVAGSGPEVMNKWMRERLSQR